MVHNCCYKSKHSQDALDFITADLPITRMLLTYKAIYLTVFFIEAIEHSLQKSPLIRLGRSRILLECYTVWRQIF